MLHACDMSVVVCQVREQCFADAGFGNLLFASPPVGQWRLDVLRRLAARVDIRVVLDGLETVALLDDACRHLGAPIRYLWEVDCGVGRFGTVPGSTTAQLIARATSEYPHASFDGLMTFGGHAYAAADTAGITAAGQNEKDALQETASALGSLGIEARARSAGTTPTSHQLADAGPITEIRPGNYVFYDAMQVGLGVTDIDHCALSIVAQVVSHQTPDRAVIDAGVSV